jgi:hypothetical protein
MMQAEVVLRHANWQAALKPHVPLEPIVTLATVLCVSMGQSGFVVSMTRANRVNKLPEVFQVQHNSCTHIGHHIRQRIIVPIGVAEHQTKLYTDSIVLFAQQVVISDRRYLFAPMPDDGNFAVSRRDDWRKLSSCNAGSGWCLRSLTA